MKNPSFMDSVQIVDIIDNPDGTCDVELDLTDEAMEQFEQKSKELGITIEEYIYNMFKDAVDENMSGIESVELEPTFEK